MNTALSQKEELLGLSKEELAARIIKLETFSWNLAQRYFAQDDFSRRSTAADSHRPVEMIVNGREAFEHWVAVDGPKQFSRHFADVDEVMRAFCREGVGEKPPPPV